MAYKHMTAWVEENWGDWSVFGGGGCTINRGGDSQDFCVISWALARQISSNLQIGAEIVHQSPDAKGGQATSGIGAGVRYDLNDHYHLLAYVGPGVQNAARNDMLSWYTPVLFTF